MSNLQLLVFWYISKNASDILLPVLLLLCAKDDGVVLSQTDNVQIKPDFISKSVAPAKFYNQADWLSFDVHFKGVLMPDQLPA